MKPRRLGRVAAADAAWRAEVAARAAKRAELRRAAKDAVAPTLSLAEQERRFQAAIDPGRAMAQDLIAAETARIEAACASLPPDARAWVAAGYTIGERSRRLGEALAEVGPWRTAEVERQRTTDDDVPHLERITTSRRANPLAEKSAATRRIPGDRP